MDGFGGIVARSVIHFPKNIKKEGGSIKKIKVSSALIVNLMVVGKSNTEM